MTEPIHPRVIERPGQPPAFIIEEQDIDAVTLPPHPENASIPFSVMIDSQDRVHVEYNHTVYDPASEQKTFLQYLRWLKDIKSFFFRVPPNIIAGSLMAAERDLIGGLTAFMTPQGDSICPLVGLLPKDQLQAKGVPDEVRRGAVHRISDTFEHFSQKLGAKRCIGFSAGTPSQKIMERRGWTRVTDLSWRQRWQLFWEVFPVSLRRSNIPYQKLLR